MFLLFYLTYIFLFNTIDIFFSKLTAREKVNVEVILQKIK